MIAPIPVMSPELPWGRWWSNNLLHPPHLTIMQADFYAVRMVRRVGEDILHHATRALAGRLILLQHDINEQPGMNVLAVLTVHNINLLPYAAIVRR